jgi:hypothetical protein
MRLDRVFVWSALISGFLAGPPFLWLSGEVAIYGLVMAFAAAAITVLFASELAQIIKGR